MNKKIKTYLFSLFIIALIILLIISIVRIGFGNNYINPQLRTKESQQISTIAQNMVSAVRLGDSTQLSQYYSEYINQDNINALVLDAQQILPSQSPTNIKLIGIHEENTLRDGSQIKIIQAGFEYQFSDKWYEVVVNYLQKDSVVQLLGMHFTPLAGALETVNKVDLASASLLQYFVLALSIIIAIFILTVLIFCIRTPNLKRKWLWIIFVLFGIIGFHFNWTTQNFSFSPISFQLLGAGYFRSNMYGPLIITFSLPIGAIIFLIKMIASKRK